MGSGGQGDADMVGGTGNEASVFPMTVKDKEGNIYRVDDVPGEEDVPDGGSAGGSSGGGSSPKKLVVTPVGKSGERLSADELNVKRLDSDIAEVVFRDVEGSVYAFDGWKDVYKGSILIREKYEQLGQNYHVASKLVPSGKSDVVGAEIRIVDKSVDPEKVVFRTAEGTEFPVKSFDKRKGRYVLTVVGGKANDGQEVYALYPKKEGGYYNLGKLLVVSYPEYKLRVKIVPLVKDFEKDFSALRHRLESVYGRVGIGCEVMLDDYFEYDDPMLFDKGSGLLSAYNSRMKALNGAYSAARGVDDRTSYIFITEYCGQGGKRDFSGFMPLNSQFGYVARGDFRSVDKFCIAVAHELAHGRLSLRHPFDKSLGLSEGDVAENLMDYRDGTELAKWQWDVIHDPGVVVRIFERDKDAMKQHTADTVNRQMKIEMFNDDKKFEKGTYQLISALPAMPKLSFKIPASSGVSGKVKFQLKIEYRRDNRSDEDYFPGKDKFEEVDVDAAWLIDWQDKIRGGKASLICHTEDSKDTLIFYIRGTNPSEQDVKNFLVQEGYSTDVWFLTRLIRQESQFRQFNPGTKYGSAWTSSVGCPNWGTPHGWGIMQLDVLNSSCGELHSDGKYRPSAEALWNWKENLKKGYAFLTGEKKGITRGKILVYEQRLEKWYEQNPADSIVGYSNQIEGRVTFMHASSPHFNFDWGLLDQGAYSFMEAMWIKSYNGNSRGFYYDLIVPIDTDEKPYWTLNRFNNSGHNYVEAVGSQNE